MITQGTQVLSKLWLLKPPWKQKEHGRVIHRRILQIRPGSGVYHLCLLSSGQSSVIWPRVTVMEAGFCSGWVCLEGRKNEVCEQLGSFCYSLPFHVQKIYFNLCHTCNMVPSPQGIQARAHLVAPSRSNTRSSLGDAQALL